MSPPLFLGALGALAAPVVSFLVLVAAVVLLVVRVFIHEQNVDVTKIVHRFLDGSIAALVLLVLLLVFVRFSTIA